MRALIAERHAAQTGISVDANDQVLVTAGNMQGMSILFHALLDPGDEVIVTDPGFASHVQQIKLCGGRPRYWPLDETRGVMTDARGVYAFAELPPGTYTIQVLFGKANVSKVTTLPAGAKFRANFRLDPRSATEIMVGMVVIGNDGPIDPTTASSTYSSKLLELP